MKKEKLLKRIKNKVATIAQNRKMTFMPLMLFIIPALSVIFALTIYMVNEVSDVLGKTNQTEKQTWVNFMGSFLGSTLTVFGALVLLYIQRIFDKINKIDKAQKIIDCFLKNELIANYELILSDSYLYSFITVKKEIKAERDFALSIKFETYEFDKIKYELLNQSEKLIYPVIAIYNMFILLNRKNKIRDLSESEIVFIRDNFKRLKEFIL